MRQAGERVEVGAAIAQARRVPCVCDRQAVPMMGYTVIRSNGDGALPCAKVACGDCDRTWTRIG